MRNAFLTLLVGSLAASSANATCQVGKLLEFKVTMRGQQPLTDVVINGRSIPFVVDSGAFFSTISPGMAGELGLKLEDSPVQMEGIGGVAARTYVTNVKTLDLAGIPLHNIQFVVGGSEFGVGGLLGQNILGFADVEYDLEHGTVRLMRSKGCSADNNLAYWAGQSPVSDLAINSRDAAHPHTVGTILVNGVQIRAIFDTGADASILSLQAAKRAGLTPSSPGAVPSGQTGGVGRSMVDTWLVPVDSVTIGTEQVLHIKLRIGDIPAEEAEMLVGADFFLSHRVYVANASHRMYFTYDGGPVFNVTPSRIVDSKGAAETVAADSSPAPTDAAGFSRRGAAETSRRDYKAALADLDRAIAMDATNGQYILQRARARFLAGDFFPALDDLDLAVKVAPNDPEFRLARAESYFGRGLRKDALNDLEAADALLPNQADERLTVAAMLEQIDKFEEAIANDDQWIAAHPDDSRQPAALNGRCWARALLGRDLPLALKDCDAALRRVKSTEYFDSRGLVELRMGQYDRAIADYTEALRLDPKNAWSLYGRGLARHHKNDPLSQKDLDAAIAIDPFLPFRARKLGIS